MLTLRPPAVIDFTKKLHHPTHAVIAASKICLDIHCKLIVLILFTLLPTAQ
jgi:hypothetical protein